MSSTLDASSGPRRASATHNAAKRRRAARACLSCRTRKVRCDVSRSGPPCMNCSLDDIECVVKARKPKASSRQGAGTGTGAGSHSGSNPGLAQETACDESPDADLDSEPELGGALPAPNAGHDTHDSIAGLDLSATHVSGDRQATDGTMMMDFAYEDSEDSPQVDMDATNELLEGPGTAGHAHPTVHTASFLSNECFPSSFLEPGLPCPQPQINTARHYSALHPNSIYYNYYPFLTLDNLCNCMPQDVDFMEAEGCFHLPTRSILDQIVRQYFLHIHPFLPLLNEGDFWEMYYNKRTEGQEPHKMSLLVFQSIMFASCNFVNWSMESARSFGYSSVRSLRAVFYRRAKLLYDFGAEASPIPIAQAALLLSYWTPPVKTEMKLNTVWLSVAIQNAKDAEAPYFATLPTVSTSSTNAASSNSISTSSSSSSCANSSARGTGRSSSGGGGGGGGNSKVVAEAKRQNLLKRLWWCCVIRDRILPLGLRRDIQITRAHFDFDAPQAALGLADIEDEIHRSLVYSAEAKRAMAHVLSHLVQLCAILTDVLLLVFPLDGALDQARGRLTLMPLEEVEIRKNKHALLRWYQMATSPSSSSSISLAAAASAGYPGAKNGAEMDWPKHDSVLLFTHMMYTYYHSARMALYHYELQHYLALMATTAVMDSQRIRDTREAIQNAFSSVTENFRGLKQRNLTRWLPISMLAFAAFPLALHVLNTHLSSSAARRSPREEALVEVMKTMHGQYDGVDFVAKTIRKLIDMVQDEASSAAGKTVTDWSELLTVKPKLYLRMSLAMDMSMSTGRFPDKETLFARLEGAPAPAEPQHKGISRPLAPPPPPLPPPSAPAPAAVVTGGRGRRGGSVVYNGSNHHQATTEPAPLSSSADMVTALAPDFDAADEFSSFQGAISMTDLFDTATLADLGLDGAEFGMDGTQGLAAQQVVDPAALSSNQELGEIH